MDNVLVDFRALLATAWRRRWRALAVFWLVCIVGWPTVALLPDKYESAAQIFVDTQTMLGPLLKGIAVQTDIDPEVKMMERTLLSRPNLAEVARATDLDLEATTPAEMEKLFERLRNNIEISSEDQNLFLVTYTDTNPVLAKAIVQSLLTIFVEGNLGQDRADVETAQAFIERQIEEYERKLKAAELRLADFKAIHAGMLAGGGFSAQLDAARNQYRNARFVLQEAIIKRDQLRAQHAAIPQFLEVEGPPQIVVMGDQAVTGPSPLLSRIQEQERDLDSLRLRFTERHPDVVSTKRMLDMLRQQYEEEEAENSQAETERADEPTVSARTKTTVPNALYEQVKLKLVEAETEVNIMRRRLAQTKAEVERLERMVQTAPSIEAQLIDLDRDYNVVKRRYEELLARLESARISQAVKATTDTVQFRIIEPPQVPAIPSAPDRMLYFSVVLLAGLATGVGFVILLDQMDDTFRAPEVLQEAFGLPVLGCVSNFRKSIQRARRLMGNLAFGTTSGALAASYVALVVMPEQLSLVRKVREEVNIESLKSMKIELLEKTNFLPFIEGILQYGG